MINRRRRRPYWRRTKSHLLLSLLLPMALVIAMPFVAGGLNQWRFLGFPLGYFALAHGAALVALFAVLRFASRQDRFDREHGAHEEFWL